MKRVAEGVRACVRACVRAYVCVGCAHVRACALSPRPMRFRARAHAQLACRQTRACTWLREDMHPPVYARARA
eukprot:4787767-Pleurochrysis_carterae.AAC.1